MKYIISKTGEKISFNLTSARNVLIDTIIPIQITDEEFTVLEGRLGTQISSVEVPGLTETAPEVEVAEVTTENEVVEITPEVAVEEVVEETETAPEVEAE